MDTMETDTNGSSGESSMFARSRSRALQRWLSDKALTIGLAPQTNGDLPAADASGLAAPATQAPGISAGRVFSAVSEEVVLTHLETRLLSMIVRFVCGVYKLRRGESHIHRTMARH